MKIKTSSSEGTSDKTGIERIISLIANHGSSISATTLITQSTADSSVQCINSKRQLEFRNGTNSETQVDNMFTLSHKTVTHYSFTIIVATMVLCYCYSWHLYPLQSTLPSATGLYPATVYHRLYTIELPKTLQYQ